MLSAAAAGRVPLNDIMKRDCVYGVERYADMKEVAGDGRSPPLAPENRQPPEKCSARHSVSDVSAGNCRHYVLAVARLPLHPHGAYHNLGSRYCSRSLLSERVPEVYSEGWPVLPAFLENLCLLRARLPSSWGCETRLATAPGLRNMVKST